METSTKTGREMKIKREKTEKECVCKRKRQTVQERPREGGEKERGREGTKSKPNTEK